MVALTGVATGLPGHPMTVIRLGGQHLPFGYYAGSLQHGIEHAPAVRRVSFPLIASAFAGVASAGRC